MSNDPLTHLYSRETLNAQPSAIRDICALVARPEVRSLAGGWPDPEKFPRKAIRRIFDKLISKHGDRMLQYGSTEGLLELRQILADRMITEGMPGIGPDNLMITHGSAQGMHLAAQVFVDREDVIFVGLPTYFGGPGAVRSRGGRIVGIAVDDDGMIVERLRMEATRLKASGKRLKGVYVIPNFQNPSGATLSLERRRQLVRLAETHDLIIFEDDPYGELRFEGTPLPSLRSLDRSGRVIQLRSLSKTFVPGLRLGWAVGDLGAIRQMVVAKQFADAATNTPAQYQMERYFPNEVTWNRPGGGFFIFVQLPTDMDAADLFRQAVDKNVAFVTGQPFFVDGSGHNTLRLSYAQARHQDIEYAIRKIGNLMKAHLIHNAA